MSNIRFSVYKHSLIIRDNQLINIPLIVIKDRDTGIILGWTDFHKYIKTGKNKIVVNISSYDPSKAMIVCKFLNYVVFDSYHIDKLTDITVKMVRDFLVNYGLCNLPNDVSDSSELGRAPTHRSKSTVERAVNTIIDFMDELIKQEKNCKIKKHQLYTKQEVFSKKRKKYYTIKKPAFPVYFNEKPNETLRNLPNEAFMIIMNQIVEKHPNLIMITALCSFAGLRPSEACNVRRTDSALGPGIRFEYVDGEIYNVFIDLKQELNLRSDYISVGKIKKERTARVHPSFLSIFGECYDIYMQYMEGKKFEEDYGPLTVNRDGRAMTYQTFFQQFQQVVQECIPIMLSSDIPEICNYGLLLQEYPIGPHILRH